MVATNNKPSNEELLQFVGGNFNEPGHEFDDWTPTDWVEE